MKVTLLLIVLVISISLSNLGLKKVEAHDEEPEGQISAISAEPKETGHSEEGLEKSHDNKHEIEETNEWTATDYSAGDIVSSTYTVQLGDTLWEIAEAYLGNGQFWNTIVEKNSAQIGLLSNGSQALIYPGQILQL